MSRARRCTRCASASAPAARRLITFRPTYRPFGPHGDTRSGMTARYSTSSCSRESAGRTSERCSTHSDRLLTRSSPPLVPPGLSAAADCRPCAMTRPRSRRSSAARCDCSTRDLWSTARRGAARSNSSTACSAALLRPDDPETPLLYKAVLGALSDSETVINRVATAQRTDVELAEALPLNETAVTLALQRCRAGEDDL